MVHKPNKIELYIWFGLDLEIVSIKPDYFFKTDLQVGQFSSKPV